MITTTNSILQEKQRLQEVKLAQGHCPRAHAAERRSILQTQGADSRACLPLCRCHWGNAAWNSDMSMKRAPRKGCAKQENGRLPMSRRRKNNESFMSLHSLVAFPCCAQGVPQSVVVFSALVLILTGITKDIYA